MTPCLPKAILVVDDESSFREAVKMALEFWGYSVWLAEDGEEALSIFKAKQPLAVLSDVVMPRLDGLALLRALKKSSPAVRVILVTAYPTIEGAISAIKEGAEDVLTKPIDYDRLRIKLEQLFGDTIVPS